MYQLRAHLYISFMSQCRSTIRTRTVAEQQPPSLHLTCYRAVIFASEVCCDGFNKQPPSSTHEEYEDTVPHISMG